MYSASLFAEETEEEKAEREGKAQKKGCREGQEKLRAQGKTAEAEQVLKKMRRKARKGGRSAARGGGEGKAEEG